MLKGYRTYIVAAALAAVAGAEYLQFLTPEVAKTLETVLVGGGFAFLRAAKGA